MNENETDYSEGRKDVAKTIEKNPVCGDGVAWNGTFFDGLCHRKDESYKGA